MRQAKRSVVLCIACATLMACGEESGPTGSSSLGLHDGAWLLTVRQITERVPSSVTVPTAPLPDSAYVPVPAGTSYRLELSEQGRRLTVMDPRMLGVRESTSPERLTYALTEGTFAGGRVAVWAAADGLEAELTIYGSGVAVVRSERGPLRETQ
jgi:hypothetical protein